MDKHSQSNSVKKLRVTSDKALTFPVFSFPPTAHIKTVGSDRTRTSQALRQELYMKDS
jgi:hypothetical protein